MRKIPCLFRRDPTDRRRFLPDHQVQLPPDAIATVKWDGVAVELDGRGQWWVRAEARSNRGWPEGFRFVEHDHTTLKDVGWVPVDLDNPDHEMVGDAILAWVRVNPVEPGTYEAVPNEFGPWLIPHGDPWHYLDCPTDFDGLRRWLSHRPEMEGIVWWDADRTTPLAKVRRYDVGLSWRSSTGGNPPGGVDPTPPPASGDGHPPSVAGSPVEADECECMFFDCTHCGDPS